MRMWRKSRENKEEKEGGAAAAVNGGEGEAAAEEDGGGGGGEEKKQVKEKTNVKRQHQYSLVTLWEDKNWNLLIGLALLIQREITHTIKTKRKRRNPRKEIPNSFASWHETISLRIHTLCSMTGSVITDSRMQCSLTTIWNAWARSPGIASIAQVTACNYMVCMVWKHRNILR